jgi:hypothetical protein
MLIVSKFKDYYDSSVGLGIDKTIVYNRKKEHIDNSDFLKNINNLENVFFNSNNIFGEHNINMRVDNKEAYSFVIGFCGKLYPGIILEKGTDKSFEKTKEFIYDKKEAYKELNFHIKGSYNNKRYEKCFNTNWNIISKHDPIDIHRKYNTPIFIWVSDRYHGNEDFIINPRLKAYSFYKVFDSYTCFQEIQMFISGVLPQGDDVPQTDMSEKQKVNQYGFDEKYGFRKRPKN